MRKILNHYKNEGITRLIFFDFTCSSFINILGKELHDEEMYKVREMNEHIISGGKKYKKSYKKKNKKSYKKKNKKSCKKNVKYLNNKNKI
jgi:hypothetical protein